MTSEPKRGKIPIDLRERVEKWIRIIKENIPIILSMRKEPLENLVKEMSGFILENKYSIIFYDDAKIEPCPKCDYGAGRVYQWLGRWYFMCMGCAHGMPEPVLVDWGEYGKLNEEDKKYYENRKRERKRTGK